MGCGCKKAAQQAAGARAARPTRVPRSARTSTSGGLLTRKYYVLPLDESLDDEEGFTLGEKYNVLAEAQKRLRDLGPGWRIESRRE